MPRRASLSIDVPEVELSNGAPQLTQVVARPTSSAVIPPQTNGLLALSDALKGLNPALEKWATRKQAEADRANINKAQFQALQDGYRNQAEAQAALSTDADPVFRRAYMNSQGLAAAHRWNEEVSNLLKTELQRDDWDPSELQARIKAHRGDFVSGVSDPDYMDGFNEAAVQTQFRAEALINEEARKKLRTNSEAALRSDIGDLLGRSASPEAGWLNARKERYGNLNLTRGEVEAVAWDMASQVALTTLNPAMLQEFAEKASDGRPSFAEREPDKYLGVLRQIKAGLSRVKENIDTKEAAHWEAGLRADIERLEQAGEPVTETHFNKLVEQLDSGLDSGYIKKEGWVANYMRLVEVASKNTKSYKHATAAAAGTLRAQSELSGEERDNALRAYLAPRLRGLAETPGVSEEERNALALRMQTEAALANRMIYPDHRSVLSAEFLKLPRVVDGKEQMPPSWPQAAQLAYGYFKGLQSPGEFIAAFPDQTGKDAAAFYLQYFSELEKSPTRDPSAAYLATLRLFRRQPGPGVGSSAGSQGAAKFSKDQHESLSKKVYKGLEDNRNWADAVPFIGRAGKVGLDNDRVFRTWFAENLEKQDPQLADDALVTKLTAEFQAQHMLVNGRWVNSSQLPTKFDRERTVALEKALEALKPIIMLNDKDGTLAAKAGGDWRKADIYLLPRPVQTSPDVEYEVMVQGEPTGVRVNLDALVRQYNAGANNLSGDPEYFKKLLTKHRATVDAFMAADASSVGFTPELEGKYRTHFDQMREAGLLTDSQYKDIENRLDTLKVRRDKAEAEKLAEAKSAAGRKDPAASALKLPLEPDELAAVKTFPRAAPNPDDVRRLFKHYAAGTEAQLGAAVTGYGLGYSPVRFQNAAGTFVGFGSSLDRPDKELIEDLYRAGVRASGGSAMEPSGASKRRMETLVKALRAGQFRLTEPQALRLAEIEWERSAKAAKLAFGSRRYNEENPGLSSDTKAYQKAFGATGAGWDALTPSTRFALTALKRFTKTDKDFQDAVSALERQDLGVVAKHLTVGDPKNPQAVASLIRLLGGGLDKARAFIHSQF